MPGASKDSADAMAEEGQGQTNPFAFNSLSKMMASQEAWRKNPCPSAIDFSTINRYVDCIFYLPINLHDQQVGLLYILISYTTLYIHPGPSSYLARRQLTSPRLIGRLTAYIHQEPSSPPPSPLLTHPFQQQRRILAAPINGPIAPSHTHSLTLTLSHSI